MRQKWAHIGASEGLLDTDAGMNLESWEISEARGRELDIGFLAKWRFFFFLFRAAPAAYGSSQANSGIRAVAVNQSQSHSNVGSLTH